MNIVKVCCSQTQRLDNQNKLIGFEATDETDINVDYTKMKLWTAWHLRHWYELQRLQGRPTFMLTQPIEIKVYWNKKLLLFLTQRRVAAFVNQPNSTNIIFRLKNSFYTLIAVVDNLKTSKIIRQLTNTNYADRIINAIDYINSEKSKYGSPIIYTSMTN